MSQVTLILEGIGHGESRATDELLPLVYDELRQLAAARMAREQAGQTLQPTALVHEVWLRLAGQYGAVLAEPRPFFRSRRRGHAPHPDRAGARE